jgi:hypothetical protein
VPTKSILRAANVPIIGGHHVLALQGRRRDDKQQRYWSVVQNTQVAGRRVVQRHVLYLGEIKDTQELAWRRVDRQAVARATTCVQVKLLAREGELYVLAQSRDRVAKERAMRWRQLKRLWSRLKQMPTMPLTRKGRCWCVLVET